jgi:hypothetical protein
MKAGRDMYIAVLAATLVLSRDKYHVIPPAKVTTLNTPLKMRALFQVNLPSCALLHLKFPGNTFQTIQII